MLDTSRDAPAEHHDKLTVAKTFALAIDEAAKLHAAAEPLIVHAALLAPEPIPLFLFAEAREKFGEPLASALAGDDLDEAVAALRAFALVDREAIVDERDPAVATDTIRLHRLVREIAAARCLGEAREDARRGLVGAVAKVYPAGLYDPRTWPRARRLDGLAVSLIDIGAAPPNGAEELIVDVAHRLATYRDRALGAYAQARPLIEHGLAIAEKLLGPDHPKTATCLSNLCQLLHSQGNLEAAQPFIERALAIDEVVFGPDHPFTAAVLLNLALVVRDRGDLSGARPLFERALLIDETVSGPEHDNTAQSLNNLASLLQDQGELLAAQPVFERALAIREKVLGPEDPYTAQSLNNLAGLLRAQGDLTRAPLLCERSLVIREKVLGPEHPDTAGSLYNLALLLQARGDFAAARPLCERALAIREKWLGPDHPETAKVRANLSVLLRQVSGDAVRSAK
jgi:tetratricopeptide (TPR) repeat protein